MGNLKDEINISHVKFFGKLAAGISHDMNNAVGIINEEAGLIDDLCLIAKDRGEDLDPERIYEIVNKIKKQVKRAGSFISSLNKFSHISDKTEVCADPIKYIRIVTSMMDRFFKEMEMDVDVDQNSQIEVVINPFLFSRVIGEILYSAAENHSVNSPINISIMNKKDSYSVCFNGIKDAGSFIKSNPELTGLIGAETELKEDSLILNIIPEG